MHACASAAVALIVAYVVLAIWYPFPYSEISSGRELFLLICFVDIVSGPLLTAVIFSPEKIYSELKRDIAIIAFFQLMALCYGLSIVWQSRPVYLVLEIDRYKVIAYSQISQMLTIEQLAVDSPGWRRGPQIISIREPINAAEKEKVLFESMHGGPDYAERPEFYAKLTAYDRKRSWENAKPLGIFLEKNPSQKMAALEIAKEIDMATIMLRYIPVVGRHDWVAVINSDGDIQGYLPGDGF